VSKKTKALPICVPLPPAKVYADDIRYFEDKLVKALGIPKNILRKSKLASTAGASYFQACIRDLQRFNLLKEAHETYQRNRRIADEKMAALPKA
jgi:hypothetical protein